MRPARRRPGDGHAARFASKHSCGRCRFALVPATMNNSPREVAPRIARSQLVEPRKRSLAPNLVKRFNQHAEELLASGHPVVLAGDHNVVPTDADIHATRSSKDSACGSIPMSPKAAKRTRDAEVDRAVRGLEGASDPAPGWIELRHWADPAARHISLISVRYRARCP